ncbi:DUF5641 domain-containing protein [Trichonephila clavipes]|uniref:DUF5641 domain-containing protein n=1 Tax=Trichonephila clavipes TaxID=2585209 RepID=A0A8X6R660_TRICX|nr:DUF5641 domain-containing protein [Trichonephila clavipes]
MDSLKLKTCELWWNGPKFLMSNQYPQRQIPVAVIKDPAVHLDIEPDLTNLDENRLDNWQKITKIIQLIWKRWSVDYLNILQQRNKWHFEKKNAKIGDMVIIKEDNLPSCHWSLDRINNIYPGKDSKVRVVEVKTTREINISPCNGFQVISYGIMGNEFADTLSKAGYDLSQPDPSFCYQSAKRIHARFEIHF